MTALRAGRDGAATPSGRRRPCRAASSSASRSRARWCSSREVLLLDEPLSNLDAKLRAQMRVEFRALQQRLGITTLYVTHDQEEAMALSDRVVVMRPGPHPADRRAGGDLSPSGQPRPWPASSARPTCSAPMSRGARASTATRVQLDVVGRGWRGRCEAASEVPAGRTVTVMVRPEDISIAPCRRVMAGYAGPDGSRTRFSAGRRGRSSWRRKKAD